MKKIIYLTFFIVISILTSCSLQPFEDTSDENAKDIEHTAIEENSSLFTQGSNESQFIFETNDLKYQKENGYTLWCTKYRNTDERFEPFCTTVSKESGKSECGFGVVFLQQKTDETDFLMTVMINTKGQFIIGSVSDGKFTTIKNWQECPYLLKGNGIKNKIEVYQKEEPVFSLKLNDYEVCDFTVQENISIKESRNGYVTVIAQNENFPDTTVRTIFENK